MRIGDRVVIKSKPYENLKGRVKAISIYDLCEYKYTIKLDCPNLVPPGWRTEPIFSGRSLVLIGAGADNILINE